MKARQNRNLILILLFQLLVLVVALLVSWKASAQVPAKFNYQAVARNSAGSPITNQSIGFRLSLVSGSATGTIVYIEHQTAVTNAFGVFSLAVGGGVVDFGNINSVPWSSGNVWMKVDMDITGGSSYITMGTTQLLSVPYAMVSGKSLTGGNSSSGSVSLDSLKNVSITNVSAGQVLKYDGIHWVNSLDNAGGGSSFWNTAGNNMFNLNLGNVGIGVTIPDALLHVQKDSTKGTVAHFKNSNANNTANTIFAENSGNGNALYAVSANGYAGSFDGKMKIKANGTVNYPHFTIIEATAGQPSRLSFMNAVGGGSWQLSGLPASSTGGKFSVLCNGSEYMTFTTDGNVGLFNSLPAARFHVSGTSATNSVVQIDNESTTSPFPTLSITSLGNGELIKATKTGIGYGMSIQKTGTLSSSAAIYASTNGSNGEGIRGSAYGTGGFGIYGNATGAGSAAFTGVYGYASGSSGVDYGIYGQQGASPNDYAGYFNGNVGYTGNLSSTSDARLKSNITSITFGLNTVMQLKPSLYEYRHDGDFSKMNLPLGTQFGLVAQDLEKVLPQLVSQTTFVAVNKEDGDGQTVQTKMDYKSVNYIGLIPVLVKAIQEQQNQIEELKAQILSLQSATK